MPSEPGLEPPEPSGDPPFPPVGTDGDAGLVVVVVVLLEDEFVSDPVHRFVVGSVPCTAVLVLIRRCL